MRNKKDNWSHRVGKFIQLISSETFELIQSGSREYALYSTDSQGHSLFSCNHRNIGTEGVKKLYRSTPTSEAPPETE
jgi:hypothetical protein